MRGGSDLLGVRARGGPVEICLGYGGPPAIAPPPPASKKHKHVEAPLLSLERSASFPGAWWCPSRGLGYVVSLANYDFNHVNTRALS